MSSAFASFHLTIAAPHGDRYPVTARTQAGHEVSEDLLLPLDDPTLTVYQMALDYHTPIDESVVIAVGQLLYQTLFQGTIAEAFATARAHADQQKVALRIHLAIDTDTRLSAAAALPWELMATAAGRPLMLEHALVRTFSWNDPIPNLGIPPGEPIRLAVTSALPAELANHPIAAEAEVAIIHAAITHSARPIDLIEVPHLTRDRLTDLLTNQRPHIVHHIGHGSIQRGMGYLDIERADQSRDRLSAREFSTMLHQSGVQLVVLNACHTSSAGESLLTSFAPIFITDRIPAVIGMQAAILNRTGHCFANAFYATLGHSGSIDASLIAARKAIHADGHEHGAWGFITLYSRVTHGGLWQTQHADHTNSTSPPTVIQNTIEPIQAHGSNILIGNQIQGNVYQHVDLPEATLKASLAALEQEKTLARIRHAAQQIESDRLLTLRLQGFVGRVNELAAIREQIAAMRPTGGYVLIKAAAGEGKSSSIAKLIQEAGIAQTPHHFIALTTGREYQLGLLRAVVAQLILKHGLTVSYFPEESYPAMKGEFTRILDELSKQGIQETIYLDGLDQLQPDIDGSRDLSFLPPQPPPGIVMVLGSRPDETLKPLEILHRVDYDLPPLREDDALALWRSVQPGVSDSLLHNLYTALKGNALFVHLAADTMQGASVVDATSLIKQIEQNPSNLFGITLERIKGRSMSDWRSIWKPMLALLLVAQEPLRLDVLGDLLGHDHDTMQDAVWVFGGLVSQGIDQRVALHHLLFRDYLTTSVFNDREVKRWHQRLADWCDSDLDAIWADDRDPIEQARRVYARHHYIMHLFLAENWTTLWKVLDTGDYGEYKTRFDPSTRLYALDLDRGRESAINAGQSTKENIQNLPRLWKYSLLRTSLNNRMDQSSDELFVILAMLGRLEESLARIELISDPIRQIGLWSIVVQWCDPHQQKILLYRMESLLPMIPVQSKQEALQSIIQVCIWIGDLDQAYNLAQTIDDNEQRASILCDIAQAHPVSYPTDQLDNLLNEAFLLVEFINDPNSASPLYHRIVTLLTNRSMIVQAAALADKIDNPWQRARTLYDIVWLLVQKHECIPALTIAYMIEDSSYLLHAMITITLAFAEAGDSEQVERLLYKILQDTATIRHIEQSIQVYSAIAEIYTKVGNAKQANSYFHAIETLIHSIDAPEKQVDELCFMAKTYNRMKMDMLRDTYLDNAIALAHTIDEPSAQGNAFKAISKAYTVLGDLSRAITISTLIADYDIRETTLGQVIQIVLNNPSNGNSQAVLNEVRNIAQSINHSWWRIKSTYSLIYTYVNNGNLDQAHKLLGSEFQTLSYAVDEDSLSTLEKTRVCVLCSIAAASFAIQNLGVSYTLMDEAITITKRILEPRTHIHAVETIAQTYAVMNDHNQATIFLQHALEMAKSIDDGDLQFELIDSIATISIRIGNIEQAMTILESVNTYDRFGSSSILPGIAIEFADRGQIEQAIEFSQSVKSREKDFVYRAIAQAYCTAGDQERAKHITQSIKTMWKYIDTLSIIARSYVSVDKIEQAKDLIAEMKTRITILPNDNDRDYAYGSLSQALATIGQITQAIETIQLINTTGSRDEAIYTLAQVYAAQGNITHALAEAKSITHIRRRIALFLSLGNEYRDDDSLKISLIQKEWQASRTIEDTWELLQLINPLLNDYPWLGTVILEEEKWVNAQLKRLG